MPLPTTPEAATGQEQPFASAASENPGREGDSTEAADSDTENASTEVSLEESIQETESTKTDTDNAKIHVDQAEATAAENDISDTDSDEAVGKEEAAERDQDLMVDDDVEDADAATDIEPPATSTAEKVTEMFQRLLNLSGQSGQFAVQLPTEASDTQNQATKQGAVGENPAAMVARPSQQPLPTMLQNGRLVCNLPDHPIHAGATAIVAVIVGKTLTVSNAGDSRGVLCRNGNAFALSYDHKPQSEIERGRIQKAGGFVNQVGRVNGNLNLSRSIGDLKYKQVQGISKAEQMITAQPDILQ